MRQAWLRGSRRGFTLIELILTISIIVLLALLVAPKIMNAYPRVAAKSEGLRLRADLTYAQQLAITNSQKHRVSFDTVTEHIRISRVDGANLVTVSEREIENGVDLVMGTFAGGYVEFNVLGEPSAGGTVTLRGTDGTAVTVTVKPGTGLVTVACNGDPL